jgi:hypothetical protein
VSKQPLKAITLHRPWGHAIAHLGKDIENRTWKCPLPIGSYVAIHDGNTEDSDSDWFMGSIGWKFSDVVPIEPVYCRGQQGLWNVEGEALGQCRAAYKVAKSGGGR